MSMVADHFYRNCLRSNLLNIYPRLLIICLHTLVSTTILGCLIIFVDLICRADSDFVTVILNNKFLAHAYHFKEYFFSLWVVAIQYLGFALYSAADVLDIYGRNSTKVMKIRDALHDFANHILFGISFPLSLVVTMLFWGFYLWNRETIYPKIVDDYLPPFLNHMMHTFPIPLTILYMYTDVRVEPSKPKTFFILTAFMTIYAIIFLEVRKRKGCWVYSVLELLSAVQVMSVLSFTLISPFGFFFVGYHIHSKIKVLRLYIDKEFKKIKNNLKLKVS